MKDFHSKGSGATNTFNAAGNKATVGAQNQENSVNGAKATDKKEGIPYFSYDQANERDSKKAEP